MATSQRRCRVNSCSSYLDSFDPSPKDSKGYLSDSSPSTTRRFSKFALKYNELKNGCRFSPKSQRSKKPSQNEDSVSNNLIEGSPHGTLTGADSQKLKGMKTQSKFGTLLSSFTKDQTKQEILSVQLTNYSINGLPEMPALLTLGQRQCEDSIFEMETHWTDVVDNSAELSKKGKDQQEAIWEILHTEVEYIKKIKVIIDLFMCCLINLQNESILNEIDTEKVFSNIYDVYQANCQFWEEYLYKVLQESRTSKKPLNPSLMKDGFFRFEEIFHPYTKFCLEQRPCLDYIKAKYNENELFKTFVLWAEKQSQCNRLKLTDLVVKPMQQLTRYKLLLQAILKKTEVEEDREDLRRMIEQSEKFVQQVDTVIHQKQEFARLSLIIDRIESYDVIDIPNGNEEVSKLLSEFCKVDLTCPVPGCGPQQRRNLLLEGPLKLRDPRTDVHCFLFTDMILVTKPRRGDKVKVIKPPMRLDKIVVHPLRDGNLVLVYLNEYHVASALYTFSGDTRMWVENIKKAQDEFRKLRNAALENQESRFIYLDPYDEEDENSSVFNISKHYWDHSPDSSYNRLDSTGSVETYMPNLSVRSSSQETLTRFSVYENDRLTPNLAQSASMDGMGSLESPKRPRSATLGDQRPRSPRGGHYTIHRSYSGGDSLSGDEVFRKMLSPPPHSGNIGLSPPDSPKMTRGHSSQDVRGSVSKPVTIRTCLRTDSGSSAEGKTSGRKYQQVLMLPNRPDLVFISDEAVRSKLNQRRLSRDGKRYFTADAIQDIRKDGNKDASIHKRLSWNLGTAVDITIDEKSGHHLKEKAFSSDSLRSMPSSSGVSSTGSLHPQDVEISEDFEDTLHNLKTVNSDPQLKDIQKDRMSFSVSEEPVNSCDNHSLHTQNKSNSKSMPDISRISIVSGEMKDGIASVQIGSDEETKKKKHRHAQILKMKKQLLLNSTLEASEV